MTRTHHPMETLRKLKPTTVVDQEWPAPVRDAALDRLIADATAGTSPRTPRRRRLVVAAALTATLLTPGVAAAAGVLPESFTSAVSFWQSETDGRVAAAEAQRLAQQPGPDGTVLSVWAATGADGTTCVSALFEAPGALDRPAPEDVRSAGGQCNPRATGRGQFGDAGGSATPDGVHTMWTAAGPAVTAELQLPDGTTRPALSAAGMFFCWYAVDASTGPPILVGYDAAGHVVGRRHLPDLTGTPPGR